MQESFDLTSAPARDRADFFVAPGNAMALAMLDNCESWPGGKLVLTGPAGSGKTHLTHIWATDRAAQIVAATDLPTARIGDLCTGAVAVEDEHATLAR